MTAPWGLQTKWGSCWESSLQPLTGVWRFSLRRDRLFCQQDEALSADTNGCQTCQGGSDVGLGGLLVLMLRIGCSHHVLPCWLGSTTIQCSSVTNNKGVQGKQHASLSLSLSDTLLERNRTFVGSFSVTSMFCCIIVWFGGHANAFLLLQSFGSMCCVCCKCVINQRDTQEGMQSVCCLQKYQLENNAG